jgi:cell division protein FtsB
VSRPARIVRLVRRLAFVAVALAVCAVVAVQFAGIVVKNVALAGEVSATRAEIDALRLREAQQRRTIARLSDPSGAIPEIHDELHMVGPNEEIIYVRGLPPRADATRQWNEVSP